MNYFAFILEGETELVFYSVLLEYLCRKNHATKIQTEDDLTDEATTYELTQKTSRGDVKKTLKLYVSKSVNNIPSSSKWFHTYCTDMYGDETEWTVFLCYDKDSYEEYVNEFHEGDWDVLRMSLKGCGAVIDLAASADIEDVMLSDIDGVCRFIGRGVPSSLSGRKGKIKMKNLFRNVGGVYHSGSKARLLIESLDMGIIMDANVLPLKEMEEIIFGEERL